MPQKSGGKLKTGGDESSRKAMSKTEQGALEGQKILSKNLSAKHSSVGTTKINKQKMKITTDGWSKMTRSHI
jgi:hypothetical protein